MVQEDFLSLAGIFGMRFVPKKQAQPPTECQKNHGDHDDLVEDLDPADLEDFANEPEDQNMAGSNQ